MSDFIRRGKNHDGIALFNSPTSLISCRHSGKCAAGSLHDYYIEKMDFSVSLICKRPDSGSSSVRGPHRRVHWRRCGLSWRETFQNPVPQELKRIEGLNSLRSDGKKIYVCYGWTNRCSLECATRSIARAGRRGDRPRDPRGIQAPSRGIRRPPVAYPIRMSAGLSAAAQLGNS